MKSIRFGEANIITLNPGEKVNLIATDDKKWCLVEKEDGTKAWLDIGIFGTNNDVYNYFDGLCYAD